MADIETLTVKADSANQVNLNLASVSMTAAGAVSTLNFTGANDVEVTGMNADITTIDASGMATGGSVIQTGRSATVATTVTGSSGADTFIHMNSGDNIAGGTGADTLDVNKAAILGGINVDLASTTAQVTTYNGSAASGTVTGFVNVDLAGFTGFGAQVTAASTGSTILGTGKVDSITLGAAADVITYNTAQLGIVTQAAGSVNVDTIVGFTAGATLGDKIELSIGGLEAIVGITDIVAYGKSDVSIVAATTVVVDADADAANDAGSTPTALILLAQGVADLDEATVKTALEIGGSNETTINVDLADNDAFIVAADNGVDTAVYLVGVVGTAEDDDQFYAADKLQVTKLITLSGIAAAETLTADNFDFIA